MSLHAPRWTGDGGGITSEAAAQRVCAFGGRKGPYNCKGYVVGFLHRCIVLGIVAWVEWAANCGLRAIPGRPQAAPVPVTVDAKSTGEQGQGSVVLYITVCIQVYYYYYHFLAALCLYELPCTQVQDTLCSHHPPSPPPPRHPPRLHPLSASLYLAPSLTEPVWLRYG